MKRISMYAGLIPVLLAGALSACGANGKVPQEVLNVFQQRFPNAVSVKWDEEEAGEWEAGFKLDRESFSASFKADGTWIETEHEVAWQALPEAVMESYRSEFRDIEPEEIEISERPDGTYYEFAVEQEGEDWIVLIDSSGRVADRKAGEEED